MRKEEIQKEIRKYDKTSMNESVGKEGKERAGRECRTGGLWGRKGEKGGKRGYED